jgi:hypothetical protein
MPTNLDRADWADKAIRAFRAETGSDHEDSLGDLLTDLMHWADTRNFDFAAALDRARGHYAAEIAEVAGTQSPAVRRSGRGSVWLHLLHGRTDPDQRMPDWGFTGPVLGPFEAIHVTYKEHIRCITDSRTETELELGFHEDLLIHDGQYYGDYEIRGEQT